jgi:hypothetical protein
MWFSDGIVEWVVKDERTSACGGFRIARYALRAARADRIVVEHRRLGRCASELGYHPIVVTPDGVVSDSELRSSPSPRGIGGFRQAGSRLPVWLKSNLKDVRELIRSVRFARDVASLVADDSEIVLVWQRHELFGHAGHRLARQLGCPLVVFTAAPKVWEARRWGVRRGPLERSDRMAGGRAAAPDRGSRRLRVRRGSWRSDNSRRRSISDAHHAIDCRH